MSGIFDPNTFGAMTFEGANSTEFVLLPVSEYLAQIKSKEIVSWEDKDKTKGGLKLKLQWEVPGDAPTPDGSTVKELTGRDSVTVKQEIMLDLTDTGGLDMGKGANVRLGRLREALGLNNPGQPWTFDMFVGQFAKISVAHRPDNRDPKVLYAEVKEVAKP